MATSIVLVCRHCSVVEEVYFRLWYGMEPAETDWHQWKLCTACARESFLQFLGHMEIFVEVNLKRFLKTRVAEIREVNILAQENLSLRIVSSILLFLNALKILNTMTFLCAIFFSTISSLFSFLNSKNESFFFSPFLILQFSDCK